MNSLQSCKPFLLTATFVLASLMAKAELAVTVERSNKTPANAVIPLKLKNTFKEQITSARATVFLLNDQGKVVGQGTKWIIGGTKDAPPLAPDASTTYNFVIHTDKPFTKTKVNVGRLILEGGKVVDPRKNVVIQE